MNGGVCRPTQTHTLLPTSHTPLKMSQYCSFRDWVWLFPPEPVQAQRAAGRSLQSLRPLAADGRDAARRQDVGAAERGEATPTGRPREVCVPGAECRASVPCLSSGSEQVQGGRAEEPPAERLLHAAADGRDAVPQNRLGSAERGERNRHAAQLDGHATHLVVRPEPTTL